MLRDLDGPPIEPPVSSPAAVPEESDDLTAAGLDRLREAWREHREGFGLADDGTSSGGRSGLSADQGTFRTFGRECH